MFSDANYVKISVFLLCVIAITNDLVHTTQSERERFFDTAIRSLSLPSSKNRYPECDFQMPSLLLVTYKDQQIIGNGSNSYLTNFKICCKGYKPYKHNTSMCAPDCKGKCRNGICVEPDICECFQGFVKNEDGECVQTCPLGCLNGVCNIDGSCKCNRGYELDNTAKYCKPLCRNGCDPGKNCTRPGHCRCPQGFITDTRGGCEPKCNPDCRFGRCTAPNTCRCYLGYNLKNDICQAQCFQVCGNGTCTSTDHCQCKEGYQYDPSSTSCIPQCSNCLAGVCVAPEVCQCYEGFVKVNGVCEPHCKKGCVGGFCEKPNFCRCKYGEVDEIGHCRYHGEKWCTYGSNGVCFSWSEN